MIPSFIITFRETLEAALIVGVILSYLFKIRQIKYNNIVYVGIGSAIVASIIGAIIFNNLAGGFTGRAEEIFEGVTMLVGAVLLTTMIIWMMKQKQMMVKLEDKVATEIGEAHKFGIFSLVFIAVLREGVETVIFLEAANFVSSGNNLVGALAGIIAAIFVGYLMFVAARRINIKKFFNVTSILLILFAAGLIAHGIHEFEEAGVIPIVIDHVWDINPTLNPDGSYPFFHEKGYGGSILTGLFGYNGDPSLIEVFSYIVYIVIVLILWKNTKIALSPKKN
ncbi:MAG: hypothetical protein A3J62_03460 [Candidatus Buchananbacteria bacterium RIFCSPHIGHO2_02_FULL_38_8]|uniref:High-affinity iron transporter n=1 Tax=Candidatus Buchananbacteria bacterium RIFCSPHIGHO2_02_FULL_38_8 TaxID=1797538 RepID=A0A1G1Y4P0_9BACT|nr:MAG: hypothetical protein A3J62_03460 [Candidatus Buchananbacteria bacterium RIFCSPHIGHO2_02_FULL_38_8]